MSNAAALQLLAGLLLSFLSFVVSILAFLNSRKTRLDSKAAAVFQLKSETQSSLRELEVGWQEILNDLRRAKEDLEKITTDANILVPMQSAYAGWTAHTESSLANVANIREKYEANFDTESEESARTLLRLCKALKITLSSDKAEFKTKIDRLHSRINHTS
jgi:hypothetical protein